MTALLIKSLQNPALYPHTVDSFKLIETHISWVLLTGSYAYKIKKPVDLGFLDFSSLAQREHYCREELRLNSRLAPNIYLEVIAISGKETRPELEGMGAAIEYAVKMRQFPPDNTFDHLLLSGLLTRAHIQQTAIIIADFHAQLPSANANTLFGHPASILLPVQENFSQIEQLVNIDKPSILQPLKRWSAQQHAKLRSIFTWRKQAGFIRECHGDLHLGNLALIENRVVPFDGIEFNPALYWIDGISEVAFLVMDLQSKQRHDLAYPFLNTYFWQTGDYSGLKLLRFYLVYRSMVRAKVEAIRAHQNASEEERQQALSRYHNYLQLAQSYTQPEPPMLIIMQGVSGSGKSWLAEQIINRYQIISLRSDVERKRLHKQYVISDEQYSATNRNKIYQHLLNIAKDILQANYSVLIDATFLEQQQRTLFLQLAEQCKVPFIIIHTEADQATLLKRIHQRSLQADNVSDATQAVLDNQQSSQQALSANELQYSISVNTANADDLDKLWRFIDSVWQRAQ
ncbi:MAG: AAA family ATPase [Methyloprofundus sp.]|nr:AAA family ATPase [Methyloprofundus sp.]MDT8425077.1 AAA family ATPase [Methyloprofundus sp.]